MDDTPGLNDRDTTFYGVLQDVGTGQIGLAKLSDNMLTVSGSNTYSGQTLVEDGRLPSPAAEHSRITRWSWPAGR